MNKKVLRNLSYGVYAVSALGENRMSGCIANSIMQITSSPATLAVSMNHDNYTHECIEKSGMFAVSILSEKTDPNIISQLGFQSSRDVDKFMNVPLLQSIILPLSMMHAVILSVRSSIKWKQIPTQSFLGKSLTVIC